MTVSLAVVLKARDGLVVACARRAEVAALRAVGERTGAGWRTTSLPVGRAVVSASARPAVLQDLLARIETWRDARAEAGVDEVVAALQEIVVGVSARETARRASWEDAAVPQAPSSSLLVAGWDEAPRIVHVSATGEAEDRTASGYDAIGAGELFAHLLLPWLHHGDADAESATLAACAAVLDAEATDVFGVAGPPAVWAIAPAGRPRVVDAARAVAGVPRLRARMRQATAAAASEVVA